MNQNPTKHTKVLIIGSGPAGYTAAVYAARAMLNPVLVHGMEPGGQLTTTTDVENYPGFAEVIQGPWLMDQMKDQAKAVGTEMIEDHISSVNLKSQPFEAVGDSSTSTCCRTTVSQSTPPSRGRSGSRPSATERAVGRGASPPGPDPAAFLLYASYTCVYSSESYCQCPARAGCGVCGVAVCRAGRREPRERKATD